jgi:hypothetical protein
LAPLATCRAIERGREHQVIEPARGDEPTFHDIAKHEPLAAQFSSGAIASADRAVPDG